MPLAAKCTVILDAYDIRTLITEYMMNAYNINIDNQDISFRDGDDDEVELEAAVISTELSPKLEQGRRA